MSTIQTQSSFFPDTKPHFEILDGLRGVAAIMVVWFHIFEAYNVNRVQHIGHGHLGVDFFFILSGFVIGYAYDDRWSKMGVGEFFKRRIIRLQPMLVIGAVIGCAAFLLSTFLGHHSAPIWIILVAMVLNMFLIPMTVGMDFRGWGELYPMNNTSWSLFFEYLIYILYAFFIRKLSNKALWVLVSIAGASLAYYAILGPFGDISVGWTLTGVDFLGGSLRVLFGFSAGLLLFRLFKPVKNVKDTFWLCTLALVACMSVPHLGGLGGVWVNGL